MSGFSKHARKIGRNLLVLIALFALIAAGYVGYVFLSYGRIPDDQVIAIPAHVDHSARTGESYVITTSNMGFGAYNPAFSFFMDGGERSRAQSVDVVYEATMGLALEGLKQNADFALFQEVDIASDRSWHYNQLEALKGRLSGFIPLFALNYDSAYLYYPPGDPIGKSKSGIATFSRYDVADARRYSLPIMQDFTKVFDLDRCYSVSRVSLQGGKQLCLYNVHLSAYISDEAVQRAQLEALMGAMKRDYEQGNHVICGGDFNRDLAGDSATKFGFETGNMSWTHPFPTEYLPEGFTIRADDTTPSCRNANEPYREGHTYVITVDGFITSGNVAVEQVRTIDTGFAYSDHNPVMMRFSLQQEPG